MVHAPLARHRREQVPFCAPVARAGNSPASVQLTLSRFHARGNEAFLSFVEPAKRSQWETRIIIPELIPSIRVTGSYVGIRLACHRATGCCV